MAYTQATLLDLQQNIADKHDSGVLPTSSATLSYWNRLINNAQQYIADSLRLVKSTSLTTVSGTIALPDDFLMIESVVDGNDTPLIQISKEDSASAAGAVFWITGSNSAYALNTPTDTTYTVHYVYRLSPLVNTTDVCEIPDPMAVSLHAYAKLRQAETDPLEDADKSLFEVEQRIAEMNSQQITNDGGQMFSLYPGA